MNRPRFVSGGRLRDQSTFGSFCKLLRGRAKSLDGSWDQKRSKMMGSLWLKFTDETLRGLEGAWKGLGRGWKVTANEHQFI